MSAPAWTVPPVHRFIRLVDAALRSLGRLLTGHARQRDCGVCLSLLPLQDGRASVSGLQSRRSRLLHGSLLGNPGSRGCVNVGRIPNVRHPLADECRLSNGGVPCSALLGIVGLHTGRDHSGAELRNHARDAPEQEVILETCRIHHGDWLGFRVDYGHSATLWNL